ncbi:MAG: CPBP family intramembrane metalloprotease [Deltaproteobacteria bacterium]|nr:CPBP family intramembrane metalloprotease [Deltaproteobacteria bacterium]
MLASRLSNSRAVVLCALLSQLLTMACATVRREARRTADEPPLEREVQDRELLEHPKCDPRWGMTFPGVGALCRGDQDEGVGLIAFGGAQLASGLAVGFSTSFSNPGATVPILGFFDLYTATALDGTLRIQRARRMPYVPQQTVSELISAPFNVDVLKSPWVWGGILGTVGVGVLYGRLTDGPYDTKNLGTRPVLFGKTVNSAVGYPVATAMGVGLFTQVGLAEEMAFRGLVQSGLTRKLGETEGWLLGSLIFGAFHATNIIFLDPQDRVDYLVKGVPFITVLGSYLGYVYMQQGYNLEGSTAIHAWYDFFISAVSFVLNPKNSPLAFSMAF